MRAIGYVRVSTDEQHNGPEAQRAALATWAERSGAELVSVHADHGVSGATPIDKRPGLLAALGEIKAGDVLVVAKRDRLARDVIAAAMIDRMAERVGARVVTVDGAGDGDSPEAVLFRRMVDSFAEYERALIRARTRAALAVKRARGERMGSVPIGSRVAADGVRLERDDLEAEAVAIVNELRAGGMSIRRIAAELNARGVAARGEQWHPTTVQRLVKRCAS